MAESLGIDNLGDVILSRKRLPYLDKLCELKGVVGEPVIFQTQDDRDNKKASILGDGSHNTQKAMYWMLGGSSRSSLPVSHLTRPIMTFFVFRDDGPTDA